MFLSSCILHVHAFDRGAGKLPMKAKYTRLWVKFVTCGHVMGQMYNFGSVLPPSINDQNVSQNRLTP